MSDVQQQTQHTSTSDDTFTLAFSIVENTPWLESVEKTLRNKKMIQAADILAKLIQDAGVELDKAFHGDYTPEDTELTGAKLHADYEPLTVQRAHSTFNEAWVSLPFLDPQRIKLLRLMRPLCSISKAR